MAEEEGGGVGGAGGGGGGEVDLGLGDEVVDAGLAGEAGLTRPEVLRRGDGGWESVSVDVSCTKRESALSSSYHCGWTLASLSQSYSRITFICAYLGWRWWMRSMIGREAFSQAVLQGEGTAW